MSFEAQVFLFVILIGLCFGSFFNVVILRGLSGESIAFPASKCPKCSTPLKWWHNIPILSYVFLRGKCAFCKVRISPQYPLVEIVTMGLFCAAFAKWGFDVKTLFAWAMFSLFLITSVTDILERVILTRHAYILAGIGFVYSIYLGYDSGFSFQNPILVSLLGLVTGLVVMELMARVGYLFAGTRAFGEGDTYIAAALGVVFGWEKVLIVLFAGFIIQFVASLPLFLWNLVKDGRWKVAVELPMFLGLSALLWFYGAHLEKTIYIYGVVLLAIMALHLVRAILKDVRVSSGGTYLPYVPAMMIAAFTGIFLWF